jgi:hypothetical protein
MFHEGSRYRGVPTYHVVLPSGVEVEVVRIPRPRTRRTIGWYRRADDERLDVIAHRFLKDATATWQLCDTNDALVADALARHDLIAIPERSR